MLYIAPSLFAADFSQLTNEVKRVQRAGANMLHLDVMDGHFVPNLSFGPQLIKDLRKRTSLLFDVHLMLTDPDKYVDSFIKAGADSITFHVESNSDTDALLAHLEECNCKSALALSPDTPAEAVFPYLDKISMVLVMTVYPGFGGQKFMPTMMDKVRTIKAEIDKRGLNVDIQVDGGLGVDNIGVATAAGANVIVAGSSIFGAKKTGEVIKKMRVEAAANPYKA